MYAGRAILLVVLWAGCALASTARAAEPAADADRPRDAQAASDWPYPQDIPAPSAGDPGPAGQHPYDIVRFLEARGPSGVQISPDGQHVAFVSRITGEPQLFVVPADGGWPIQLTFGSAVTFFSWAPDSARLLYAADRDGNEREGYTLISRGGTREQVLSEAGNAYLRFGDFDPAGTRIAYSSTQRNGIDFDVYVRELAPGGAVRQIYRGRFGVYASRWQPGGDLLLLSEAVGEDANNLYALYVGSGAARPLFEARTADDAAYYGNIAWLEDGSGFYLATNHEREFRGLAFYDLAARRLAWIDTPQHDVEDVVLFGNDRYLAWTLNDDGYSRLRLLDRERREPVAAPELPEGVYGLSGARDSARLMVEISGPRTVGEAWLWDLTAQRAGRLIAPTMAGIDPATLVVPQSRRYEARDGERLQGLLYLPPAGAVSAVAGAPAAAAPVVLLVHGGPSSQARPAFDGIAQYLVGRGFAVFDLNFRGSTGFGKRFARLDNGRLRSDAVRDIEDAVRWLAGNPAVDGRRVAILGGSYGGYLTNAAVAEYPAMFRAGVSLVGVSDWVRALEQAAPALKASDRVEYGDIDDPADRAFLESISPIHKAAQVRTPMLVVHGANDPRDPVTESDHFVQVLRDQGVEARYLRFADEGHGLRRLGNRITAWRSIADFLDEKLGQADGAGAPEATTSGR
ncbi:MAG: S9 family peptidase [Pseudomonadales bacterium]